MELTSVKCPTSVAGCTPFGGGYQTRRAHLFRSDRRPPDQMG